MLLSDIKRYLAEHRQITLADLAVHFDTDPDAMRGMLEQFVRKGKLRKLVHEGSCGNCCGGSCNSAKVEIYHWQG
ncbi:MAG: FeoC-like transcriptional regulator [Deltaproteobacteria bacterium]|nr:FeoC-like transcriptional regulator [Deltaproteobacteria bacterium]MBW2154549.1 FeoC-like transcriptional regulator [Deltaproteobacteria bacterium]